MHGVGCCVTATARVVDGASGARRLYKPGPNYVGVGAARYYEHYGSWRCRQFRAISANELGWLAHCSGPAASRVLTLDQS